VNSIDYRTVLTTNISPREASEKIPQVSKWWSTIFEGSSSKVGDMFTVRFKKTGDWYTIRIDEMSPDKKIVWHVIDAEQTWHEHRKEWVGTTIIWEISPANNGSTITMTHRGLIPDFECYDKCKMGWDYLLKESLYKFLTRGAGQPV